jgi:hypothetical protein
VNTLAAAGCASPFDGAHPVRTLAWNDYAPSLARVDFEAIEALEPPPACGAPAPLLPREALLAAHPPAYAAALLALGALDYRFWTLEAGQVRRYAHGSRLGAPALQAAFLAAWGAAAGERVPGPTLAHLVSDVHRRLAGEGLQRSLGDIPDPESRRALLEEVLDADRLGLAVRLLVGRMACTGELSWEDAQLLARLFPRGYGADPYLKKAQRVLMVVAAQWNAGRASGRCALNLTATADDRLPGALHALGVLELDPEFEHAIRTRRLVPAGSVEERALRAATVIACDLLVTQFGAAAEQVEHWLGARCEVAAGAPFHLTLTTAY